MKHTDIRKAIIDALESHIGKDALYFDGRPAVLEEGDFPAVAVFLTFYRRRYPIPSSMTGWSHVFIRCLAMCQDFLC